MAKRVDDNQKSIVKGLRAVGCSVLSLAEIGHGVPDVLAYHPRSGLHLIEIKNPDQPPSKRRLTPDEQNFHLTWRGPIHIVETIDEALKMLGVI